MYWLLIFCVLLYFPVTLIRKLASKKTEGKIILFKFSLLVAIFGVATGFLVVFIEGARFSFDWVTLSTALLFGIMLAVAQVASFSALQTTSVAIVNMSATASVLIPCVVGIIFFREPITVGNAIGIIAFFIAAYFITRPTNKESKSFTTKALFLCLAVFAAEGVGSVAMQLFSKYSTGVKDSVFMLYAYLFNSLILLIYVFILSKGKKREEDGTSVISKKLFLYAFLIAAIEFAMQQINVVLANDISAAILFPVLKSGSLVFGAVVGWAIFKEKLSVKNIVGLALCIGAVIVLNL